MKKIAFVIADLGSGGAQKIAIGLMQHLNNNNHSITCITLDDGKHDFHTLPPSIKRITLNARVPSTNFIAALYANWKRISLLRRALKSATPETVISFIATTNILTILATYKMNSKVIISERNDPTRQSFGKFWDILRVYLYKHADFTTANSNIAINAMRKYVPNEKLIYIPNQLKKPGAKYITSIDKKEKIILAVGRLHHQKAFDTLINAFSLFHQENIDWTLKIIGHGPLEETLKQQTKKLNLEHAVTFTGKIKNPYDYYAKASIFVLPSRHEGTPNALLEALSCGLPSIVSNSCDGAFEYIQHKKSGLVFEVDNVTQLSNMMTDLANNKKLQRDLGKTAQSNVQTLIEKSPFQEWDELI